MNLKPETVGFVRGGALYLEPPHKWRSWQRDVWTCCARPPCRHCDAGVARHDDGVHRSLGWEIPCPRAD